MSTDPVNRTRADRLGLLARAPAGRLSELWQGLRLAPPHTRLRAPEIGAVMVRGRAGGSGAAFNLGEMTVTRASVQLACGTVGHAWVQGRSRPHAETAALIDALLQTDMAARIETEILGPLAAEEATRRATRARKAAATRVDFATLRRGDDP